MFLELKEIFLDNTLAQIVWIFALMINIFSILFLKNNKFIYWIANVSFIWWLHYFLMWLMSWAIVNFIDIIKNYVSVKFKKNYKIMVLFVILYLIIWIITYDNIYSTLPVIASFIWIYSFFLLEWVKLKIWYLLVVIFLLIYWYIWKSIWWVTTDSILAI